MNDLVPQPDFRADGKLRRRPGPAPGTRPKRGNAKYTWAAHQRVCREYAKLGTALHSCVAAGWTYTIVNKVMNEREAEGDTTWRELWLEAKQLFNETLENEARRRAVDGVIEPVYQGGRQVGERIVYSDALLRAKLNKHVPGYRDGPQVAVIAGDTPALDILDQLTVKAQRAIRAIILDDLREQAEARAAGRSPGQTDEAAPVDAEFTEVDGSNGTEAEDVK